MPSTLLITRLSAIAKARRDSVPSAERIVGEAAKRLGVDWRYCTIADSIRLVHEVRLVSRAWLRREGEHLKVGLYPKAPTKSLFGKVREATARTFDRAGKFIRNAVVAGWLAVAGPSDVSARIEVPIAPAPITPAPPSGNAPPAPAAPPQPRSVTPNQAAAESLRRSIDEQLAYLEQFRREVLDGETVFQPARLEQYGASPGGAAQDAAGAAASARLFREGRREHLGSDEPCIGCAHQVARGWVPIGTIPSIGSQECRQLCHCIITYRDDSTGDEYPLGRMPNVGYHIHRSNFRSLGVRFRKSERANNKNWKTLIIDVGKVDASWQKDRGFYLPSDGPGASEIQGRRESALEYLAKAQREGLPFDQSEIGIDDHGRIYFIDGRHRFAALRDRKIEQLPVSVRSEDYDQMKRLFGW